MTLFSRLEVTVRALKTFFWRSTSGRQQNLTSKKRSSRGQNNIKYCGLNLRKCNEHLWLRKCEKLPQTYRKLTDLRLRNTSCNFAELSVHLRCPTLLTGEAIRCYTLPKGDLGATTAKKQLFYVSRQINPVAGCSFMSYTLG